MNKDNLDALRIRITTNFHEFHHIIDATVTKMNHSVGSDF